MAVCGGSDVRSRAHAGCVGVSGSRVSSAWVGRLGIVGECRGASYVLTHVHGKGLYLRGVIARSVGVVFHAR